MSRSIRSAIASSTVGAAVLLMAIAFSGAALADPDKAAAETLFAEGRRLMAEGRYDEACPKLVESQRLDPGGGTLLNLALCHEKQGRTASAWSEFKEALAVARRDGREDRIDFAQEHIAGLEPKLSRLVIDVEVPVEGLTVELDGAALGSASWGVPLPVDPGAHRVQVRADGYQPWSTETSIGGEGEQGRVAIPALSAKPEPPDVTPVEPTVPAPPAPQPSTPQPPTVAGGGPDVQAIIGYALGGAGLLSAAIGAGFGVSALSKDGDADAVCDETTCPATTEGDEGLAQSEAARRDATFANVFIGVGAGLVAAGIVVVLTSGGDDDSPGADHARLIPWLDPRHIGASYQLSW